MKWYRYVHAVLFVASFIPLVFSLWPFWYGVALPLLVVVPYAINEIVLSRKSKSSLYHVLRRHWWQGSAFGVGADGVLS
jgi:hypothetical protein